MCATAALAARHDQVSKKGMKKILLLFLCLAAVMATGCNSQSVDLKTKIVEVVNEQMQASEQQYVQPQETEEFMYTFKPCSRELLPYGTSKLCSVYDGMSAEYHSLFIGQALALFGEADRVTMSNEDLFSKVVCAEDKDGNVVYLEVYYGPSGPAIGGDDADEQAQKAAKELVDYIMQAEPEDFEYVSVYEDFDVTVRMGVKDGKPYYESEIPEGLF